MSKSAARKIFDSYASETASGCSALKTKTSASFISAFLLVFLSLLFISGQAKAASFAVNLNTDAHDANTGNGVCDSDLATSGAQCTLRAAIEETNALAGADFISFSLALPDTINLTIGELSIVGSVGIDGPGARSLTVQRASGAANFRIFSIQAVNTSVAIEGITIANGNTTEGSFVDAGGAGIRNLAGSSSLNLTEVTVRDNTALGGGGGIQNQGTLNITRSTVSNNNGGQGGGINNISNNSIISINNSTFSGNNATGGFGGLAAGGGIMNNAAMTLNNVTVTNNFATSGGGISSIAAASTSNIRNTIVAGNLSGNNCTDLQGIFASQSNNLIGSSVCATGFTNGVNGDKVGTNAALLNPLLGALQNNGGQTDTHALLPGSPAVDAGNNCVTEIFPVGCLLAPLATDQRGSGFPRQIDGNGDGTVIVDIGAFESPVMITTAAEVIISGRVSTAAGRGIRNVRVTITFPNGETRSTLSSLFGYYRFNDIPAGETYLISVSGKRYSFSNNTQIRNIAADALDVNFIADDVVSKES